MTSVFHYRLYEYSQCIVNFYLFWTITSPKYVKEALGQSPRTSTKLAFLSGEWRLAVLEGGRVGHMAIAGCTGFEECFVFKNAILFVKNPILYR